MVALQSPSINEESGSPRSVVDHNSQSDGVYEKDGSSPDISLWSVDKSRSRGVDPTSKATGCVNVLIECCMVVLLIIFLGLQTLSRVDELYLWPQLSRLVFGRNRMVHETTYYARFCDENDISTSNPNDLYLREGYTVNEAYDSFVTHGFTVFPNVIPKKDASELREFVLEQNAKEIPDESLLWSPQHRWLIEMGTDENPVVGRVLQHVATNKQFRSALEKIMGPNPARKLFESLIVPPYKFYLVLEMNAITSEYGAKAQPWHSDGIPDRSPLNYARSFAPAHVLLVQIQNTTVGMGATEVCPGTHFCMDGDFDEICERHSFPVHTSAGDAILMSTNAWHRGAAYTDALAKDHRVMLVLTFTPQPLLLAETRQMTHGLSYSIKPYQLGHTLNDMADAGQGGSMAKRPWSDLRSLGLYHGHQPSHGNPAYFVGGDGNYGITHIALSLMRCVAETDVADYKRALGEFLHSGGFWWLPMFLHGHAPLSGAATVSHAENSWYSFYSDTIARCRRFVGAAFVTICLFYHSFAMLAGWSSSRNKITTSTRSLVLYSIAATFYTQWNRQIDESTWTKDIVSGHRYVVHFPSEPIAYVGPTAMPNPSDVLFETRFGSKHLGMYNDFVDYHPGNRYWKKLVTELRHHYKTYAMLAPVFQDALASHIVHLIDWETYGRFLYQDMTTGNWMKLSTKDSVDYTLRALTVGFDTAQDVLEKEIRFLLSECQYGHLRDTAMCRTYMPDSLASFRRDLFPRSSIASDVVTVEQPKQASIAQSWRIPSRLLVERPQLGSQRNSTPERVVRVPAGEELF